MIHRNSQAPTPEMLLEHIPPPHPAHLADAVHDICERIIPRLAGQHAPGQAAHVVAEKDAPFMTARFFINQDDESLFTLERYENGQIKISAQEATIPSDLRIYRANHKTFGKPSAVNVAQQIPKAAHDHARHQYESIIARTIHPKYRPMLWMESDTYPPRHSLRRVESTNLLEVAAEEAIEFIYRSNVHLDEHTLENAQKIILRHIVKNTLAQRATNIIHGQNARRNVGTGAYNMMLVNRAAIEATDHDAHAIAQLFLLIHDEHQRKTPIIKTAARIPALVQAVLQVDDITWGTITQMSRVDPFIVANPEHDPCQNNPSILARAALIEHALLITRAVTDDTCHHGVRAIAQLHQQIRQYRDLHNDDPGAIQAWKQTIDAFLSSPCGRPAGGICHHWEHNLATILPDIASAIDASVRTGEPWSATTWYDVLNRAKEQIPQAPTRKDFLEWTAPLPLMRQGEYHAHAVEDYDGLIRTGHALGVPLETAAHLCKAGNTLIYSVTVEQSPHHTPVAAIELTKHEEGCKLEKLHLSAHQANDPQFFLLANRLIAAIDIIMDNPDP